MQAKLLPSVDTWLSTWLDAIVSRRTERRRPPPPPFARITDAPPMRFAAEASPQQLDAMWEHVLGVWTALARTDRLHPDNAALRHFPRPAEAAALRRADTAERDDVAALEAALARTGLGLSDLPVVAAFGCGSGQVTPALAARSHAVRAIDLSVSHLRHSAARVAAGALTNVDHIHLRSRSDLDLLLGVDLFFSMNTLQHHPPPMVHDILLHAFDGLNPGGVAFFRVPSYSEHYAFDTADYVAQMASIARAELHFVPQQGILDIAAACGMQVIDLRRNPWPGRYDRAIADTFLLRKRGPLAARPRQRLPVSTPTARTGALAA